MYVKDLRGKMFPSLRLDFFLTLITKGLYYSLQKFEIPEWPQIWSYILQLNWIDFII